MALSMTHAPVSHDVVLAKDFVIVVQSELALNLTDEPTVSSFPTESPTLVFLGEQTGAHGLALGIRAVIARIVTVASLMNGINANRPISFR